MKKVVLVIMFFLFVTLSSCETTKIYKNFDVKTDIPSHYVIGYGTETHFEMGIVMPEVEMFYHDGDIHYEFFGMKYIPKEDGTYDVIYRPGYAYNINIKFDFLELDASQFYPLLDGKKFTKSIISTYYKYSNDDYDLKVRETEIDRLFFEVIYQNEEIMYTIRTISSESNTFSDYVVMDTPEDFLGFEHRLELVEDNESQFIIKHPNGDIKIDLDEGIVYYYLNATEYKYSIAEDRFITPVENSSSTMNLINEYYQDDVFNPMINIYDYYLVLITSIKTEGYE